MPVRAPAPRRAFSWPASTLLCVVLVALVGSGCARSDSDVQADVQKQLDADPATAPVHLRVTVTKGVARITGETETMAQQTRAMDLARAVKGVTLAASGMRLNDAALAKAVKDAIAADPSVASIPLRIDAHDGEVKLFSDQTNQDQRTRILQLAQSVDGVKHAEDDMK